MFTDEDLKNYRLFKSVLRKADFDVKGEAILTVAALYKWYEDLDNKIQKSIIVAKPIIGPETSVMAKKKRTKINADKST